MKSNRGFTLTELMIIVVIIGILASILEGGNITITNEGVEVQETKPVTVMGSDPVRVNETESTTQFY